MQETHPSQMCGGACQTSERLCCPAQLCGIGNSVPWCRPPGPRREAGPAGRSCSAGRSRSGAVSAERRRGVPEPTAARELNSIMPNSFSYAATRANVKVSDGSQPPLTFGLSLSESAGSRSLHRLVGPSRLRVQAGRPAGSVQSKGRPFQLRRRQACRSTTRVITCPAKAIKKNSMPRIPKTAQIAS